MADDSPGIPLSNRSGTFYIPSKKAKQAYTVAERMRIYNVKGAGHSERKNQPGEHDQVETHTPIMYRGGSTNTEHAVGLNERTGSRTSSTPRGHGVISKDNVNRLKREVGNFPTNDGRRAYAKRIVESMEDSLAGKPSARNLRFVETRGADGKLSGLAEYDDNPKNGYIITDYIASAASGAGTVLMREISSSAASRGAGVKVMAESGSDGFYEKLGMSFEKNGPNGSAIYAFSADEAAAFANKKGVRHTSSIFNVNLLLKNQPGEHDQVETHTPIMYRGNVAASAAERVVGLESRAGLSSTARETAASTRTTASRRSKLSREERGKYAAMNGRRLRESINEKGRAYEARIDELQKEQKKFRDGQDALMMKIIAEINPKYADGMSSDDPKVRDDATKACEAERNTILEQMDKLYEQEKRLGDEKVSMQLGRSAAMREYIYLYDESPGRIGYEMGGSEPFNAKNEITVRTASTIVGLLVNKDIQPIGQYRVTQAEGTRSYANSGDSSLHLTDDVSLSTVIHEYGHLLEFNGPGVAQAAQTYYTVRTADDADKVPLKKYNPTYEPDEMTRPDHFKDPYCGKDYAGKATELVSMGLQKLYNDPVTFALEDPDYFEWTINTIRGVK